MEGLKTSVHMFYRHKIISAFNIYYSDFSAKKFLFMMLFIRILTIERIFYQKI